MEQWEKDSLAFFSRMNRIARRSLDSVLRDKPKCHFGMLHPLSLTIEGCGQDGCICVSDLTKAQGTSPQAISRNLRILEQDGLIERLPDPEDRRKTMVRLTQTGQQAHDACAEAIEHYGAAVARRLGAERLHRMREDYEALLEALEAEAAILDNLNEEKE